ncbi:flagellar hook-associated protein FlgL [Roseateles amylovorans]|uniref:Flagellar hook-associated protein FlgL n=1 Tax=Roseateles amylovorans TaxID=2978473 RepID=A0ABY6B686_9BURK|nr:flagellar hook-associated protein FlgL [Roseateles amylovorans]UXH79838.1 flagellar hook-associated protein FlgL [Roseateles amylovorans]
MRLSTANMFEASISTLQRRQEEMQSAQERLTSGKRIQRASDDPTGAARAERARTTIGQVDASQRGLEASRNSMTLAESALGDANELLQQIRESLVAAGNASYSDPERKGLATKIQGLRDQLLAIANRGDGAGGFLFSGQGAAGTPFLDNPVQRDAAGNRIGGGVGFDGISGSVSTGNMENYPLSVDGRLAWEQARSGNGTFETGAAPNVLTGAAAAGWIDSGRVTDPTAVTGDSYAIVISGTAPAQTYTVFNESQGHVPVASDNYSAGNAIKFDGMSMTVGGSPVDGDSFSVKPSTADLKLFDVLDRTIESLKIEGRTGSQITQSNLVNLRDLDAVTGNLANVRSQVGEQMNNLDGSENRLSSLKVYNQAEQSAAEDLDMTQGISDFQNQQTGYDAALKTYAMVQRMSLFQYINS